MTTKRYHNDKIKGRLAGLSIAGSMLLWLGLQWLAVEFNLSVRTMLLVDLSVMAIMIWSLIITFQIWRKSRLSDES